MVEFAKFMRKAKIDQPAQRILCPNCDKSNFTIFRKEFLHDGETYLHHARCEDCGQPFIFNVDSEGNTFVD